MKHLKLMGLLALAIAVSAPAFAETQTVKVSGALDAYWIYRHNLDLRDGNDAASIPATGVAMPSVGGLGAGGANVITQAEGDNFFMSIAQVEIAADLTDNVSVVINLLNQRDWNADTYEDNADGTLVRGSEGAAGEFDVVVDLAYVQMKEIFYAPLTLTIGRQDLWFGRGMIIGLNYQDPNGSLSANEFTAMTSFDAARATLDFEPWTIDLVYSAVDENAVGSENDRSFWFLNLNYQFAEYNAVWEAYAMIDQDKATLNLPATGAAGSVDLPPTAENNETFTIGTRAQFDPIQQITLGGEIAHQFGTYKTAATASEQDRDAWMVELFGEYRWDYTWKPMIGLQYVHFSGDPADGATTDSYEGWNGLFRGPTFGDIRDWQGVFYATADVSDQAAGTNQQHFAVYGSLQPLEDLKIDGWFYWFWNDEAITVAGVDRDDEIGQELDIHVTYDYTEDVSFAVWFAWFMPGNLMQGTAATGQANDDAFQTVSSVKVAF